MSHGLDIGDGVGFPSVWMHKKATNHLCCEAVQGYDDALVEHIREDFEPQ